MMLSSQFPELFRRENYAVTLKLMKQQVPNVFEQILQTDTIEGTWTKEYSLLPFGELDGRREGEPIPEKHLAMGYTCYGAIAVEASAKVGLSDILKSRSREFTNADGLVNEVKFAGYLAEAVTKPFIIRRDQRWTKLGANIFRLGGIQSGHAFFNHRNRQPGVPDLPNSDFIYDNCPLFALPTNPHPARSNGATVGPQSSPTSAYVDYECTITNTGGYFNAFKLPPSYWALKIVVSHYINNMAYDDNNEKFEHYPDTLLVSTYNYLLWLEILKSHWVEPPTTDVDTNVENVFLLPDLGFNMKLVASPYLIKNTWFVGKSKGGGIKILFPKRGRDEELWAMWKDEDNRTYWVSYEDMWGFIVRDWRDWVAGCISIDGETIPDFGGASEPTWSRPPQSMF